MAKATEAFVSKIGIAADYASPIGGLRSPGTPREKAELDPRMIFDRD